MVAVDEHIDGRILEPYVNSEVEVEVAAGPLVCGKEEPSEGKVDEKLHTCQDE